MTKNHERINQLFEELVPASGKAENLAGELVRAMARIGYRWYNDGDQVGIGYGRETCNPAARFLIHKGNKEVSDLAASIWGIHSEEAYEKLIDLLAVAVADSFPLFAAIAVAIFDSKCCFCLNNEFTKNVSHGS